MEQPIRKRRGTVASAARAQTARGAWQPTRRREAGVSQWQLLDFFLVLIMTIAAWRLFGRTAGVIALLALTLSFHEINAPAWLWLNLLIAIAIDACCAGRAIATGRTRIPGAQRIVLLVIVLVPLHRRSACVSPIYPAARVGSTRPVCTGWPAPQLTICPRRYPPKAAYRSCG